MKQVWKKDLKKFFNPTEMWIISREELNANFGRVVDNKILFSKLWIEII